MKIKTTKRSLPIARIRRDGGTQPRADIDVLVVDEYSERMKRGARFPAVTVFFDGKDCWLADGFHRILAAEQARLRRIDAVVRRGTREDALWCALAANQEHGLRRSNADKRRSVLLALDHPHARGLSLRGLARHCGVAFRFVKTVRDEVMSPVHRAQVTSRVVGRDGKTYPSTRPAATAMIAPGVRRLLRSVPAEITRRDIELLAELPADRQRTAVKRIVDGKSASVRDALRQLRYEPGLAVVPDKAGSPRAGKPFYADDGIMLYHGDALQVLRRLDDDSIHCVVTSPPFFRKFDYRAKGQIGQEESSAEYVEALVAVFGEIRRVLRPDGTVWLNLGSSYASEPHEPWGVKRKDDLGIPHRVAFALQREGWYLRAEVIWAIPNVAPESVTDRPTRSHQIVFLLTKSERYYYDADAVREAPAESSVKRVALARSRLDPVNAKGEYKATGGRLASTGHHADHLLAIPHPLGRNRRSVWTIPARTLGAGHPAPWPAELVEPCVLAGCPPAGTVLDPFAGTGTTPVVARDAGRFGVGIELSERYCEMAVEEFRKSVSRPRRGSAAGAALAQVRPIRGAV
ncbi:MAG: site-specific DNA-methyltransferase [Myxococcota bacterium]|nr:site-specific DNA-methyltransferase [Myxococcota bacterium]